MTQKLSKAYSNKEFLNSHEARPIRVQCELIEPDNRLRNQGVENTIVFFGSARSKPLQEAKAELSEYADKHPNESEMTDEEVFVVHQMYFDSLEGKTGKDRVDRLNKSMEEFLGSEPKS